MADRIIQTVNQTGTVLPPSPLLPTSAGPNDRSHLPVKSPAAAAAEAAVATADGGTAAGVGGAVNNDLGAAFPAKTKANPTTSGNNLRTLFYNIRPIISLQIDGWKPSRSRYIYII